VANEGSDGNVSGDAGSSEDRFLSGTGLYVLGNSIRREILRQLHRAGEARSAVRLSESMAVEGTTISYHLKVLQRHDFVLLAEERNDRGFPERFFVSMVADNECIVAILTKTERDDQDVRR
jgi:predicted transcriptional regulator